MCMKGLSMNYFDFDEQLTRLADAAEVKCCPVFAAIDRVTECNQQRVLRAVVDCKVSAAHFAGSTGYGYGDRGRETLDAVTARIFGASIPFSVPM